VQSTAVLLGGVVVYVSLIEHDGVLVSEECALRRHAVDRGRQVIERISQLWTDESGQDVAEYAVMLAVILVIVIGTVRLIGTNANTVFSQVGSAIGSGG
jgi:pilus assembly protein Flp/PilA